MRAPEAALQSLLWAANKGDLKTVLGCTMGDVKEEMEGRMKGISEAEASDDIMTEVAKLKSVSVFDREVQAADTVVLTTVFEEENHPRTNKWLMKKIDNDWKTSGSPN